MKKTAIIAGLISGLLFGVATPFSKILLANLNSFLHVHEPLSHDHPHFPDLHHRHGHKTR